ncbi:MAG: RNA polymerase sigma factor, partial [Chitinophagales bacterium]
QRAVILREIIEKLNPKYGRLIQLRYFEEMAYEEIAQELNLPLGTVKAQLFRAKDLLFNILKNTKERY